MNVKMIIASYLFIQKKLFTQEDKDIIHTGCIGIIALLAFPW